jgi:hypothetical protein
MIGRIYKIVDDSNGKVYVGSTFTTLEKRLRQHVNAYNSYLKTLETGACKRFCTSRNIICNGNFHIELIKEMEVSNKKELLQAEREQIDSTDCINIVRPLRTNTERCKEWYIENRDYVKLKSKLYTEANRKRSNEAKKSWADKNKDKIKLRQKQNYELNKDKILERKREWYKKNKLKEST